MECTQRLENTQELYSTPTERIPEQIGFLGICGRTYPVKKGPNKMGRDPHTCGIVLNLNSISRQHAVINILNDKDFMLMDLDSANKTKIMGKTLQPYVPYPLKDGDTVQFGDIFGVFRLLEDDTDLPMTQALDIPDTPLCNRHASRVHHNAATTIPESPDVSDRDDSFIVPSQPKVDKFRSPSNKYIKPSTKTVTIQPIGTSKIHSVFLNSSKKSSSLNLDDSSSSLNDSTISVNTDNARQNNENIHEIKTKPPIPNDHNEIADSIFTAATQMPPGFKEVPSIYDLETQPPGPDPENLPVVRKIDNQQDMRFDLCLANKENDISIYNAETQLAEKDRNSVKSVNNDNEFNIYEAETQFPAIDKHNIDSKPQEDIDIFEAETQFVNVEKKKNVAEETKNESKDKVNVSDEEILLDALDSQSFAEDFYSQPLLPPDTSPQKDVEINLSQNVNEGHMVSPIKVNPAKRVIRIKSDSSTDCEDIEMLPAPKLPEKHDNDDDITDCEEDLFEDEAKKDKKLTHIPKVSLEDMPTQIIELDEIDSPKKSDVASKDVVVVKTNLEDLPTQVLEEEFIDKEMDIHDLPTQVLCEVENKPIDEELKQQFSEEMISPFKIPTPIKLKRKDISKPLDQKTVKVKTPETKSIPIIKIDDDDQYYAATQDILEDLCSQRESSPEVVKVPQVKTLNNKTDKKLWPNNFEHKGERSTRLENELSPKTKYVPAYKSSSSDGEEKIINSVAILTDSQIRDVIGVEPQVSKLKKVASDPSDVEITPKKVRTFKLMQTVLPNSQEIKIGVAHTSKSLVTESSSESEVEQDSQDGTPILVRKKKRPKNVTKLDLTKKLDVKALPTRVLTRVRKPPSKIREGEEGTKKRNRNILKPNFLTEQDDNVDNEIISENITRLKTENEKKTNKNGDEDCPKSNKAKKESKVSRKMNDTASVVTDDAKTEVKNNNKTTQNKNDSKSSETEKSRHNTRRTRKNISKSKETNNTTMDTTNETKNTTVNDSTISNVTLEETPSTNTSRRNNSTLNSTTDTSRSTRSTRGHKRANDSNTATPEKEKRKRGRTRRVERNADKNESSSENEVNTRNKRHRAAKDKETTTNKDDKSEILEQSAVYSISSESDVSFPRSLKRAAVVELDVPGPKRTRPASILGSRNASLRRTPARVARTQYVLFTAFPCEDVKVKLEKLGAVVVSEVKESTVVLTLQLKRTFKLLCAVGLGRPIVGPAWVQACVDTGAPVDPWLYLLKDEATERRFNFSLQRTLAGKRDFLRGYNVSSTPNVLPHATELKQIVECSGGTWRAQKPNWICVSCSADKALWPTLKAQGAIVVYNEFVLGGVLRQSLDFEGNRLDKLFPGW